jgi:hypothetical protein
MVALHPLEEIEATTVYVPADVIVPKLIADPVPVTMLPVGVAPAYNS